MPGTASLLALANLPPNAVMPAFDYHQPVILVEKPSPGLSLVKQGSISAVVPG